MSDAPFKDAEFLKKPSGVILVDGKEVAHTRQCCHCGKHFVSIKGSGKRRGWCMNCNAITCGRPECDVCVPYSQKLDIAEGSKEKNAYNEKEIKRLEAQFPNVLRL